MGVLHACPCRLLLLIIAQHPAIAAALSGAGVAVALLFARSIPVVCTPLALPQPLLLAPPPPWAARRDHCPTLAPAGQSRGRRPPVTGAMAPRAPSPQRFLRPGLARDPSTYSKASITPSVSQSNEADDERSHSEDSHDSFTTMGPRSPARDPYHGEDTRVTSTKELAGFYMYGWAAEVCPDVSSPDREYS